MLALFRHGQTNWNVEGRLQGWNNSSKLTPHGVFQAEILAESLPVLGINLLYCSDLGRVKETLNVWKRLGFLSNVTVVFDERLRERNFGDLEGKTELEVKRYWDSYHYPLVYKDKWNQKYPNGESYADFYSRIKDWHKGISSRDSNGKDIIVGVLAHEGTNKMIWYHRNGAKSNAKEQLYKLKQPNQGMVWIV